ncbi:hypothetical protein INF26_06605 [Olsenella sp. DSM 107455]|uniref:Cyanophycin synthase-like N-terminal domain-containing protein n=1 Tax=Thermophilibacter gallinarum TaxID=2779357 RepID=A0ABR9QTX5_9ACTN|nr:hypothetical protein [Thermophilibacter gallinarum]MBE5024518.1 hypothetical protein [Thermophilibacter gallinarum]
MAQLFDFKKVTIGPRALTAVVELAPSAPLMTSENPEATELVLDLMPALADHVCLGDAAPTFGEVAADTELAHLLEHVTVELLAQTDIAGDVSSGRTVQTDERTYEVTLSCVDDVLVAGALSSAAWVLQWAYSGGGDPRPDVDAIVGGLVALVESASDQEGEKNDEAAAEEPEPAPVEEAPADAEPEPASESEEPEAPTDSEPAAEEPVPDDAELPEDQPSEEEPPSAPSPWDLNAVPRPHPIR